MSDTNLKKKIAKNASSFFGQSEDFKTRFSKLMKVMFPLLLACHLGSMLSGYFVIEASMKETLGGTLLDHSFFLSLSAMFIVLLIESGFSISSTNTIDPLLNPQKGFSTIWHFLFFFVFLGGIIFMFDYSKDISKKGAELKAAELRSPYERKSNNHILEVRDEEKKKVELKYSKTRTNIQSNITNSQKTIALKYKGRIEAKRRKSKSDYNLYLSDKILHKWAKGTSNRYERQALELEGERDKKTAIAREPFDKEIAKINSEEIRELNRIDSTYSVRIQSFDNGEEGKYQDVLSQIEFNKSAGRRTGLFFVYGALILTFLQRVYIRATGENYLEEIFGKDKGLFIRYMIVFKKIIEFPFAALLDILEFLTGRDLNGDGKIGGVIFKMVDGSKRLVDDMFKKKQTSVTAPNNNAPNVKNVENSSEYDAKDIEAIAAMAARREIEKTTQETKQKTTQKPSKGNEGENTSKKTRTEDKTENEGVFEKEENQPESTQENQAKGVGKTSANPSPNDDQKLAETHVASGVETILVQDKTTVAHYDEKKGQTLYYNLSQVESRITTYERKINQSKTNLEKARKVNDKRRIIQHEDALSNREAWKNYWINKRDELLKKLKTV